MGPPGATAPGTVKGVTNMKRKCITLEEATAQYAEYTGCIPEAGDMIDMYHCYRNEWKAYNGFIEWLMYHEVPCSK